MKTRLLRPRCWIDRVCSMMILILVAGFLSGCSWVIGVKKTGEDGRSASCHPGPAYADSVAFAATALASGLLLGLNKQKEVPCFGDSDGAQCTSSNWGQNIAGITLLGIAPVFLASMLTGWVQYSNCLDDFSASTTSASADQPYLPDTIQRKSCQQTAPPPQSRSTFTVRF